MASVKRVQYSTVIAAPPERVYALLIDPESYRQWTAPFMEGSTFEGSWRQGERIRFLAPNGEGMLAEIAENRPQEFISIRHLGMIANGVEDTESEAVRAWAPAYENYTFAKVPGGTKLIVDQDLTEDSADAMAATWQQALARLKALCEGGDAA